MRARARSEVCLITRVERVQIGYPDLTSSLILVMQLDDLGMAPEAPHLSEERSTASAVLRLAFQTSVRNFRRAPFTIIAASTVRLLAVGVLFWLIACARAEADNIAYQLTGLSEAQSKYGLTGQGQTVVIIDTGIAFDHVALGGGFGSSHRVVGGWDFAENDSVPYDDGPAGSHGTHVAGIIGAADSLPDTGVSSGVDIVSLRVFGDEGEGSVDWLNSALQWVHANRSTFRNPITAVNLSLGTTWNSDAPPPEATLEPALAQLQADGIFISAAAGNDFQLYLASGLAYPAASPHVVPVMSFDDSGQLSYFSQRLPRAIAAPGRKVVSTVPDYAGNDDGVPNDYLMRSGTNMAAPFVTGASVLIREALDRVGYSQITQEFIYNQMMGTADSIYDPNTDQYFQRINVLRAIESLLGATGDFNGDGVVSATDYTVWRDTLGSTVDPRADANRNGVVDEADYEIWKNQFVLPPAAAASNSTVPEPLTISIALAAGVLFVSVWRGRTRSSYGTSALAATLVDSSAIS